MQEYTIPKKLLKTLYRTKEQKCSKIFNLIE